MSRFAAIMMFFAWLLYGAMPGMAMPIAAEQATPALQDHSQHRDHGTMSEMTGHQPSNAQHAHGDKQPPCPHGGKTCVAPFCAACLTILPEVAVGEGQPLLHPYPAPAVQRALVSPGTAPLTPPPRA